MALFDTPEKEGAGHLLRAAVIADGSSVRATPRQIRSLWTTSSLVRNAGRELLAHRRRAGVGEGGFVKATRLAPELRFDPWLRVKKLLRASAVLLIVGGAIGGIEACDV